MKSKVMGVFCFEKKDVENKSATPRSEFPVAKLTIAGSVGIDNDYQYQIS